MERFEDRDTAKDMEGKLKKTRGGLFVPSVRLGDFLIAYDGI